ncbi:MAG: hypothetical protein JST79_19245 [Acidobacteria bacterium]|nr:hypothetical protein [Acidobacteriota bacterium]
MENVAAASKPKSGPMLPILVVLFLVSYGLMATLVMEQGRTIDSQRFLIRQMLGDSVQLSGMKMRELQRQRASGQTQAGPKAPAKNPSAQVETPSVQVTPQQNMKAEKLQRQLPPRPPKNAADTNDVRRTMKQI